jgi:hypothetical protein
MSTLTFDGTGILSGTYDPAQLDRQLEQERKRRVAEAELGLTRDAMIDAIENKLQPILGEAIFQEISNRKLSRETLRLYKSEMKQFRAYCAEHDFETLPAHPWVIASYLVTRFEAGAKHLSRMNAAIATTHKLADLPDPTSDPAVRAVLRLARNAADDGE